jgi:ABC-type antimicrobial peptide transport system permease subunit
MALVGLYAVLAQSVASRATEIGVRVALGASREQIVKLILVSGMSVVIAGIATGVVVAVFAGRFMTTQLYAVNPRDPWIVGGVSAAFTIVALMACLAPAWRAAQLDPVHSLRRV